MMAGFEKFFELTSKYMLLTVLSCFLAQQPCKNGGEVHFGAGVRPLYICQRGRVWNMVPAAFCEQG